MSDPTLIDGKYEVLGELARGGMGVVYRARDVETGREVALKVAQGRVNERRRERFRREGVLAASLDHPGIVRVHASGEHQGRPYLVQELVPKARLLDDVFRERDPEGRVALVLEAARAVAHAHLKGVIHRDLKAANVLIGSDGRVRVTDFGLALRPDLDHLTRTGELLGTPTHMAPEQFKGAVGSETAATDVWALGVILYEALTDELPFQGATMLELAEQIEAATPAAPRSIAVGVSPAVEAVCLRALRREAGDRFPDAAAFAEALAAAQQARRSWRARAAVVVGAALILVAVVVATRGPGQAPGPDPSPTAAPPTAVVSSPTPQARPTQVRPAGFRRLARLEARGGRFGRTWFVGPDRFVVRGVDNLRLYRIRRRAGKVRVELAGSVWFRAPVKVCNESPEGDRFDLFEAGNRPLMAVGRTTAELFARPNLTLVSEPHRDLALSFQPRGYSRTTALATPQWALVEGWSAEERRVHVVQRGALGQLGSVVVIPVRVPSIGRILLSPRGRWLALFASDRDGEHAVWVYALPSGKQVLQTALSTAGGRLLRFDPSGTQLVVGSSDGVLQVISPSAPHRPRVLRGDFEEGAPIRSQLAHAGAITCGTFSRSGAILITVSQNSLPVGRTTSVRCWDTATWRELPRGHRMAPDIPSAFVTTSPDDHYLLYAGPSAIELWAFGLRRG